ncbi:hypothetical protein TrRE_jg3521 [Triparma retinervis]|uniref:Uncharacterized protein n=1 Tax=Triparma retinervis TaxID=2557542 RepID=A0A9W7DXD0_9STRA|nr:hypothetical protein TrRE_jg3521 [Triparma retinervis]
MKKMTPEDQGCFMLLLENIHPHMRLAYPNGAKIMAGLAAWVVNKFMEAETIPEGIVSLLGTEELAAHALNNVQAVAKADKYPGSMFALVPYIPVSDKVVQYQITAIVEYCCTEMLALAGAMCEKLKDQDAWNNETREKYEDYPQIRPSDIKAAVAQDKELKAAFGTLFKL